MSSYQRNDHAPQTLRQVKAAYRKSNGTSKLSDHEMRVIRRRAELDERAAQCRERERRRLQNKKKREEKAQLERLERTTRPKRAGSATIGGEVINQEKEPYDVLSMMLGRKRMCKELEAENAREGEEEEEPTMKIIKFAHDRDDRFSNSNQPTGKENIPPNQHGASCSPQKTPNALRNLGADKSHNVLIPQHRNIVSPKRHLAPKKASIKAFDDEIELLFDWQDEFPSNSQLERELSCLTQGQQVITTTPVTRNAKTASHNIVHPVPKPALDKPACSKQQQQVDATVPVTTITKMAARRTTPPVSSPAPAKPTNALHPSPCPSVHKEEEEEDPFSIPAISTQDLEFTSQDLDEIGGRDSIRCNGMASDKETTVAIRRETDSRGGSHSLRDVDHEATRDRDKVAAEGSSSSRGGGGDSGGGRQACEAAPCCHAGLGGSRSRGREGRQIETDQIDNDGSVIASAAAAAAAAAPPPPPPTVRKAVQDKINSRDTVQPINGRFQEAIQPTPTPQITNRITVAHHASHSSQQQRHGDDLYRVIGVDPSPRPPLPPYHHDEFGAPSDIDDDALLQAALDDAEFYAGLYGDHSAI